MAASSPGSNLWRPRIPQEHRTYLESLIHQTGWDGIVDMLAQNPESLSGEEKELAEMLDGIKSDRKSRAAKAELQALKKKYDYVIQQWDLSEQRFDTLASIKEPVPIEVPKPALSSTDAEAVAIAIYSDWHIEERVEASSVNYVNEYNPDIAQERAEKCAVNTIKLLKKERDGLDIRVMVLGLIGDFITGYIHEELQESNFMSPTEATRFAKRLLINSIKYILSYGELDEIVIPCEPGNHGRTTHKKRFSTGYKNSYEWMMYHDLADYFEDEKKVKFLIPESPLCYLKVYDKNYRFGHGDHFRFGGGIGGLTIPLIKWIHRVNQQEHADFTFMGHWHQQIRPTADCIINGSLIGMNAYAMGIGARPEEPKQTFQLHDARRGFTVNAPIICK